MNEEAILDSYNLFVSKGYSKSIDEFKNLIRTNPNALNDSFNLFASKGYSKGLEEYKNLMGITDQPTEAVKEVQPKPAKQMGQPQEGIQPVEIKDPFKKKSFTVSSAEDGSSVSQESSPVIPTPPTKGVEKTKWQTITAPPEEESYRSQVLRGVSSGIAGVNEIITSLPEAVYTIAAYPQNLMSWATGAKELETSPEKFKKTLGITNPLLEWAKEDKRIIDGSIAKFNEKRYQSTGIVDNFMNGNYKDGFELLGSSIAQSVPTSLALMVGGAVTTPSKLAGLSTVAFLNKSREELAADNPDMSEAEITTKAIGMSAAESVFSAIGTGTIGQVYKDIIKREGREQGAIIFKNGLIQMYKKALEKTGPVAGFAGEGIEEAATQITQNMISGKPAFEGVADAFATGAGSGVVFTAPIAAINAKKHVQNKVDTYTTASNIASVLEANGQTLDNIFNVPVQSEITSDQIAIANMNKSRDILVKNLKKAVDEGGMAETDAKQSLYVFDKIQQVSNAVKDLDVTPEEKAKIATLLRTRDELKTKIENKDDVLIIKEKEQIAEINNEISNIITSSKKPEETATVTEIPSEISELKDDETVVLNVKTLDEVPEQFRDRAELSPLTEIETRDKILGLPIGKKGTKLVGGGYTYTLTGKEAKDYAIQEQAAGQVPVQSETIVSETVETGKPTTEPQGVAQEGQQVEALKDVESTTKALEGLDLTETFNLPLELMTPEKIAEAYHQSKLNNTDPKFVKKVEDLINQKTIAVEVKPVVSPTVQGVTQALADVESTAKALDKLEKENPITIEETDLGAKLTGGIIDVKTKAIEGDKREDVKTPSILNFLPKVIKLVHLARNKKDKGKIISGGFDSNNVSIDSPIPGIYFSSEDWSTMDRFGRSKEDSIYTTIDNDGLLYFDSSKGLRDFLKENNLPSEGQTLNAEQIATLKGMGVKGILLREDFASQSRNELIVIDESIIKGVSEKPVNEITKLPSSFSNSKDIAEAYHKAKADGSNPELVEAVENLFKQPETTQENETEQLQPERTGDGTGRTDSRKLAPLEGAPSVQGINGPDPQLVAVAEQYAADNGIDLQRQSEYAKVDEERAKRIADAYEEMENNPQDPKVKEAYKDLIAQTIAQYQALADAGYKFWFMDLNIPSNIEYASTPYNSLRDMRENKQMGVFPTTDGYGSNELDVVDNPMLADTGIMWPVGGIDGEMKPVLANDLFRAVHDAFGHGLEGAGFRARGEENAWQAHVRLFKGPAVGAITSETRGQNSWLNFGPYGEANRNAKVEDTVFADQKVGLMPEWTWTEGRVGNMSLKKEGPKETIEGLLTLDTKDKTNLKKVAEFLDKADNDLSKILKTGGFSWSLAISLVAAKAVIKTLKALVKTGITLQEAIKRAAAENNVTEKDVIDVINFVAQQRDIDAKPQEVSEVELPGYNRMMSEINGIIEKSKRRGVSDNDTMQNVIDYMQKSKVYENASDTQRERLVRDVRKMFGKSERTAPKPAKLFGEIKDTKMITMSEYDLLKKQLKDQASAAKSTKALWVKTSSQLIKYLKGMRKGGNVTIKQAMSILRKFSNTNMFDERSIDRFVDYMKKVFDNADYADKIAKVNKMLKTARKNIQTKIGTAQTLYPLLNRMLAINPTLIPDAVFDNYVDIVTMMGERKAVLDLQESGQLTDMVETILDAVDTEVSKVEELTELFDLYQDKVTDSNGKVDFAATVALMVNDKVISEKDAELMRKYKNDVFPREQREQMTEEEIEEEKQILISAIQDSTVDTDGLPMKDERDLARELERLLQTNAINDLDNTQLKNILRVIENINNGYMPHYAELVVERLNAKNNARNLDNGMAKAKPLPLSTVYTNLKRLLTGKDKYVELIRRNPLFYIDQVFGNFNTKTIYNAVFEKAAEAQAKFKRSMNELNNKLDAAEDAVAKSFSFNGNDIIMSKFKMMTYMLQLEYESNPDTDKVNAASKYINKTIEHINNGKSRFGERDSKMLETILKDYGKVVGKDEKGKDIIEIDNQKLYDSFNKAEKDAIKAIQNINQSMRDMAIYTAAVIRGDKIHPLNDYIHHNVLYEYKPDESLEGAAFIDDYKSSLNPSTKAKSLIERSGGITPLNFDVFASAHRGAKFVLMDYHLTQPIRTARKTINETRELMKDRKASRDQTDIFNAVDRAFEEAIDNLLANNFTASSFGDKVSDFMVKQGYRAMLASLPRFAAELSSNVAFAMIAAPKDFMAGVKYRAVVFSADASAIMNNLSSKQTNRIFPNDTMSGRLIDQNILSQTSGIKGGKSQNDVANKIQQIYNLSLKKYLNVVELQADALISTPDKMVMRPVWFGSFANEFKQLSGKEIDFDKVAANDEIYMAKNKEALDAARDVADQKTVLTGATDNAFMGVLKGTPKANQKPYLRMFNMFNGFMTNFLIYEYMTARTGVMAAMGNGSISKKQGVALLAAVSTRMILYTLMSKMLGDALVGMFVDDEEEKEDEKSLLQKIGQAIASSATSLILGRDFGNATKGLINQGVEYANEKYLDFLREGEYDPYKDALQYTVVPPAKEGKRSTLSDMLVNMMGPFGPTYKTGDLAFRKLTEPDKKEAGAIQRSKDEASIRLPLEVLGNLGMIPLYKDVRKVVNKQIYKDLDKAEKKSTPTKMSKEDMKKYFPDLYNSLYGPGGSMYEIELIKKEMRKEKEKIKKQMKDELYK
jgi:hypothetical protein